MLFHTDLPKIDNRMGGTPDHNKAIAQGFVAMYGSYPVDEANKTIIVKFEGQGRGFACCAFGATGFGVAGATVWPGRPNVRP